jgi:hypothetical protein
LGITHTSIAQLRTKLLFSVSNYSTMAHNYILQVTAGTSYDQSTHKVVAVNTASPLSIRSSDMSIDLNVRVQVRNAIPSLKPIPLWVTMHKA